MRAPELFDNAFAEGTTTALVEDIAATDSVLPVLGPASEALQQPGQFRVIVIHAQTDEIECMLVTGNSWSPSWTVERGAEGTLPIAFPAGSIVRHILTRDALGILAGGS